MVATRIRANNRGQPFIVQEPIERVAAMLNQAPSDDWVVLTLEEDGKKLALKPSEITGLWEAREGEAPG